MRFLDADSVAALGPAAAVRVITEALRGPLDPAAGPPRIPVDLSQGQFLLMPAEVAAAVGVKVVTVAPGNAARGLPRIQAAYLLFDHETLSLRAVLDGTALTTLRTPAVSVAGILPRLPQHPLRVAVVGAGPQAVGHVATLAAVRELGQVSYLVRDPARTALDAIALGSPEAREVLRAADVVVCATSAATPVFDSALLRDDVVVVAVGSHTPDARELDAALLGRSTVMVEDIDTALREAGDVVLAIGEGVLSVGDLVTVQDVLSDLVVVPAGRPLVFKTVGMSWQDLVIATAVAELDEETGRSR